MAQQQGDAKATVDGATGLGRLWAAWRATRPRLLLGAGALALAGLGLLVWWTQGAGTGALRARLDETTVRVRQLDAETSLSVLRARSDVNSGYDNLSQQAQALAQARQDLLSTATALDSPPVRERLALLDTAVTRKLALLDEFKAENAVLRESLKAFPQTVLALQDHMARSGLGEEGVRRFVGDLVSMMFSQYLDASAEQRKTLADQLDLLHAAAGTVRGRLPDLVRDTVTHGRTILDKKDHETALLAAMAATQIPAQLDALDAPVERWFASRERWRDLSRWLLLGVAAALLGLLGWAGNRLLANHRQLGGLNRALALANESLEARVAERTADLHKALDGLKASQSQLVQSEKLASLGQMVAGIAHEINTPLAYVNSGLESTQARLGDLGALVQASAELAQALTPDPEATPDPALAAWLELVQAFVETDAVAELGTLVQDGQHGLAQISDLVRNLKDFSRLDRSRVATFDLNDGVRATLRIARNLVKHKRVSTELGALPLVQCAPSQINQVLLNLIGNAAQATEDDGRITVRTYALPEQVVIEVSDEGCGIAPEVLPQIFDPFFTTKKVGEGTGLGLSIVHRIVSEHGGRIEVDSEPGVGTQFRVLLPLVQAADLPLPVAEPAAAAANPAPAEATSPP